MKKKIILLFIIFINSIIYGQLSFSGIVYYESTINSKKLEEYLSNKRDKIKNKKVVKSLDKVYLYAKAIRSKLSSFNNFSQYIA